MKPSLTSMGKKATLVMLEGDVLSGYNLDNISGISSYHTHTLLRLFIWRFGCFKKKSTPQKNRTSRLMEFSSPTDSSRSEFQALRPILRNGPPSYSLVYKSKNLTHKTPELFPNSSHPPQNCFCTYLKI